MTIRPTYEALNKILRTTIHEKRVERITERIGGERVAQRIAQVSAWPELKLIEKLVAPPGVIPLDVVSVMADGGRLQLRDPHPDAKSQRLCWEPRKNAVRSNFNRPM